MQTLSSIAVADPLSIVARGLALSYILVSLEYVTLRRYFTIVSPLSWNLSPYALERPKFIAGFAAFSWLGGSSVYLSLCIARVLVSAVLLIYGLNIMFAPVVVSFLLSVLALEFLRQPRVLEGSDHMLLVVNTSLLLPAFLPGSSAAYTVAVCFIAVQLAMSYFFAGLAKLASAHWRTGDALTCVMRANVYGQSWLALPMHKHRLFALVMSWTVILWELFFPLLIWIDALMPFMLGFGVAFHVANATVLGLNRFVVIFVSCYPVIVHLTEMKLRT